MKYIGYLWLFYWLPLQAIEYKTQQDYAQEAYNTLYTYVTTCTTNNNFHYVKTALNYGPMDDIFDEALSRGYPRIEIIRFMYYISLRDEPVTDVIVEGIRLYITDRQWYQMVTSQIVGASILMSLVMTFYSLRFFKRYFYYNLPDLTSQY